MLFSELAERYLEDKESGRKKVRLNTLEGYKSAMDSHVLPKWGAREVASISYEDVQEWVDSFPEGIAAERSYKVLRQHPSRGAEAIRGAAIESGAEGTARGDVCVRWESLGFRV